MYYIYKLIFICYYTLDIPGDLETKINSAVFPGLQGGPHNNQIGALATALHQAKSEEFVNYQRQVLKNAAYLAESLIKLGYKLTTGGTEVHLCLVDLRGTGLTGSKAEKFLEAIGIACNKNTGIN